MNKSFSLIGQIVVDKGWQKLSTLLRVNIFYHLSDLFYQFPIVYDDKPGGLRVSARGGIQSSLDNPHQVSVRNRMILELPPVTVS